MNVELLYVFLFFISACLAKPSRKLSSEAFKKWKKGDNKPRKKDYIFQTDSRISEIINHRLDGIFSRGPRDQYESYLSFQSLHRDMVIARNLDQYWISPKQWQLSGKAFFKDKDEVVLVNSTENNEPNSMILKQALPTTFLRNSDNFWYIKVEFRIAINLSVVEDFPNPEHDAAILLTTSAGFDEISKEDFNLVDKIPYGTAFGISIRLRRNFNSKKTFLTFNLVRTKFNFSTRKLGSCVISYNDDELKRLKGITSEVIITKAHNSGMVYFEIPMARCALEIFPSIISHDDVRLAVTAWSRLSLSKFIVQDVSVALKNYSVVESTNPLSTPIKDLSEIELNEIDNLTDILESALQNGQSLIPKQFRPTDDVEVDQVNHLILANFELTLPLKESEWLVFGAAHEVNGKLKLNSMKKPNETGIVMNTVPLPEGQSSWQIDSTFYIDDKDGYMAGNIITLRLVDAVTAEYIRQRGVGAFSKSEDSSGEFPFFAVSVGINYLNNTDSAATIAGMTSKLVDNSKYFKSCLGARSISRSMGSILNETVTVRIQKKSSNSVRVKVSWFQHFDAKEINAVISNPACTEYIIFEVEEWPFDNNASIHVIAGSYPGPEELYSGQVELVSLTASPMQATVQADFSPRPPVFANSNQIRNIDVEFCEDISLVHCLLDCSTQLREPSPLTLWYLLPHDSRTGHVLKIEGAEGFTVLNTGRIRGAQVGDRVICMARNTYGFTRRSFTLIKESAEASTSKPLSLWQGVLLFVSGMFACVLLIVCVYAFHNFKHQLFNRTEVGDTYSLLQRGHH